MTVCRCRVCGARQVLRSRFELECNECGGELIEEDAYDPEPEELRCATCGYVVSGAGLESERDDDYSGGFTVDDLCPRCEQPTLVPRSATARAAGGVAAVLAEPEFALARRIAGRLLEGHWTGEMPVDVWKIAGSLGLEIVVGEFGHQGRLEGRVIKIPASESRTAQRFAIAHEIGHHELRHQVNDNKIEAEANAFASELLIPRHRLHRAVEAGLNLHRLRALFDVSRDAIVYALEDERLLTKVKN